jgi:ribosome biogenesis GTPase
LTPPGARPSAPAWRDLDEDDVPGRRNPRGSRPRTKRRPSHAEAIAARVVRTDRGRYRVVLADADGNAIMTPPGAPTSQAAAEGAGGGGIGREITAMRARELGRTQIVVGDLVHVVGDTSGRAGTLARIVRVAARRSVLRRSADDADPAERVIVADADQLVVVTALADPPPRPRLIDRCLAAAYDAGIEAVLCLTKADLADAAELRELYEPLGVTVVATGRTGRELVGLDQVRSLLAGRVTALVGHSGVGKSTLVNALVPGADRATGEVNDVTGRGRHTSSQAVALALPGGGWVVDTPGIRSFGLGHVTVERLLAAFADLAEAAADCPRGCTHLDGAPDCALDDWAAGDARRRARVDSFRRLLASRTDERGRV